VSKADLIIEKIAEVATRAGRERGIEPVEVQLVGGGGHRVLRIFIDKPGGVTHEDCQFISEYVGTVLDVEDTVPGGRYTLEVSSPGVERKLVKPRDFERVLNQRVRVVTREPISGQTVWQGLLEAADATSIRVAGEGRKGEPGVTVTIPLNMIAKAQLKFEW
jgi:ribosome maturation factor RimP